MVVVHPESLEQGGQGRSETRDHGGARWTCALVNNMPDGAFVETERQFLALLGAGSGDEALDTRLYSTPSIPRGEAIAARIADDYAPVGTIVDHPPDLLIVTGANPVEPVLQSEPFWPELVTLLSWASEHVQSMMLSCLSAHAALSVFDGLERQRLTAKCTGVFGQTVDTAEPLATGLRASLGLPHSRLNSIPTGDLRRAGYHVPVLSDVGWSLATRRINRAEVVLVQAHPEYGPTSLLREYHRDARRFVRHERDDPPALPLHCVGSADRRNLERMHRRITGGERDPAIVDSFPFDQVGARAPWPWRAAARRLYANWLAGVPKRSG